MSLPLGRVLPLHLATEEKPLPVGRDAGSFYCHPEGAVRSRSLLSVLLQPFALLAASAINAFSLALVPQLDVLAILTVGIVVINERYLWFGGIERRYPAHSLSSYMRAGRASPIAMASVSTLAGGRSAIWQTSDGLVASRLSQQRLSART